MLFLFVVFSGCSSEPTPRQGKAKQTDVIVKKSFQPVVNVIFVTDKSRQLYKRYCSQCH